MVNSIFIKFVSSILCSFYTVKNVLKGEEPFTC